MKEQKRLNVAIAGREYVIATDEDEEALERAVELVSASVSSILDSGQHDASRAAVLTAIRFAHEVVRCRGMDLQREIKMKELIDLLS